MGQLWSKLAPTRWREVVGLSPNAIALDYVTRSLVGQDGTGGRVTPTMVVMLCGMHALGDPAELTAELTAHGDWHDDTGRRRCAVCKGAKPGKLDADRYVCGWLSGNFSAKAHQVPEARRAELRSMRLASNACTRLRDAVADRDGGLCRYCGCRPRIGANNSKQGKTLDHVDPSYYGDENGVILDGKDDGNVIWNLVVACRGCNSLKLDNRPEEVEGLVLRSALPPDAPLRDRVMAPPDRSSTVQRSVNDQ